MEKTDTVLSRRKLLVGLGGATVLAGAVLASSKRVLRSRSLARVPVRAAATRPISLAYAAYEEWLEQVGSVFSVDGSYPIQLIGVRALNSAGPRPPTLGRDRAFVAQFNVLNGGTMAGDLIYTASHPESGLLRMFLSASSDPATPGRMLAVFN